MKQLIIYFGKQNDSVAFFGGTADTIKCDVNDEFNVQHFYDQNWVEVKLTNGTKYINTNNILWFDLIEKPEDKE